MDWIALTVLEQEIYIYPLQKLIIKAYPKPIHLKDTEYLYLPAEKSNEGVLWASSS